MFKKALLFVTVALPFSFSQSFADWGEWEAFKVSEEGGTKTVKAVWKSERVSGHFILQSASSDDLEPYKKNLKQLPIKDGYPSVEGSEKQFKAQNLDRQRVGNPFHLFELSYGAEKTEDGTSLGFVQFGRMPSMDYPEGLQGIEGQETAHHPIIERWISLGITEKIDAEGGLDKGNIRRITNRGLAMILPMFRVGVPEDQRTAGIEACYELVGKLTEQGSLLPVEKTVPHAVMSLFHPDDPNIGLFEKNYFKRDENPGFGWFYPSEGVPQPRTMVTRYVEIWDPNRT